MMLGKQRVTDQQLTDWDEQLLNRHRVHFPTDEATVAHIARQAIAEIRGAWSERDVLQQRIDKALAITYASDDGTEYAHTHRRGEGEPECPACWAHDIRATLTGTEPDRA